MKLENALKIVLPGYNLIINQELLFALILFVVLLFIFIILRTFIATGIALGTMFFTLLVSKNVWLEQILKLKGNSKKIGILKIVINF